MKIHMMEKYLRTLIWLTVILMIKRTNGIYVTSNDIMKCSYGERGSLTATCVNANSSYFKNTPYRFDQLDETLTCLNCTLTSIDPGTFDISGNQIKTLNIRSCRIQKLSQKAFVGLIFLENLDLSFNNIRSIYPGTFTGVKKITFVDLSHNEINILSDDGFLELLNLEVLFLQHNNIMTISNKAFNGLQKLNMLALRHNQITNIREVFNNLTSLKSLELDHNNINMLNGTEFLNLTSLTTLSIAYNRLQDPIIEMIPQNNLTDLYLNNNAIKTISPNFLKGFHQLEALDLSNNSIEDINQKVLQNLFQLTKLDLSNNKIQSFQTGAFSGLPRLEYLNVSHNQLKDIQITGVFSIHSLHTLDLSHNVIKDLDYVGLISRLPRLAYLRMEDNMLPCDLEDEMETYFSEDNFKFELYEPTVGQLKCIQSPVRKSQSAVASLISETIPVKAGIGGAEVTIFILISIQFICIAFLFALQYKSYRDLRNASPNRTTSVVNLVSSEPENRDGEYLREYD